MNTIYLTEIILFILMAITFFIAKYMMNQVKARIALDKKFRKLLIDEINANNLDVDKMESIVRKNSLTVIIEKELLEDEIDKFKHQINIVVENAISRLADEEKLIIYRSIENSKRNNTSQYQNKVLLDSINDLKHA